MTAICPDCLRQIATPEQWSSHPGGCECAECLATCWGCDGDTAARARAQQKRADLERRTVDMLEQVHGLYRTAPKTAEAIHALLAEWKAVRGG